MIRYADELCFSIILVGAGNGFRLGHQAVQNGRGGFVRRVCSCRDLDGIFLSGSLALLACVPAAALVGIALWMGSLPLCLLAACCTGWLVGPALTRIALTEAGDIQPKAEAVVSADD